MTRCIAPLLLVLFAGCASFNLPSAKKSTPSPPPKSLSIKPRVVSSAPSSIKPPEKEPTDEKKPTDSER